MKGNGINSAMHNHQNTTASTSHSGHPGSRAEATRRRLCGHYCCDEPIPEFQSEKLRKLLEELGDADIDEHPLGSQICDEITRIHQEGCCDESPPWPPWPPAPDFHSIPARMERMKDELLQLLVDGRIEQSPVWRAIRDDVFSRLKNRRPLQEDLRRARPG